MKKHLFFFVMAVLIMLPAVLRAQQTCLEPTNFTASNVGSTSAVLSWSQPGGGNEWEIVYSTSSDIFINSYQYVMSSDTTYTLTGLEPNTTYYVVVCKVCGSSLWSTYSDRVIFTTTCDGSTPISNIAVYSAVDGSATVNWQGVSYNYTLRYRPEGSGSWTTVTGITSQSYTITGLATGDYDVEVSADCDPGHWISTSFSIFAVHSTANWYAYANSYHDWQGWFAWGDHFVSFSVQNPTNMIFSSQKITSSQSFPYADAVTYADGYVWCITEDDDLVRAALDNDNRTISNFDTIKSGFPNVISMCYNPLDGKIYYTDYDNYLTNRLHSFYPSNPEGTLTTIGILDAGYQALAINRYGEAYCFLGGTGMLYRMDLSNATTTQVASTGFTVTGGGSANQGMAFDLETDELFLSQNIDDQHYGLFKIDPTSAKCCFIGLPGGEHGAGFSNMFMVANNAIACSVPTNLTISNLSDNSAKVSWSQPGGGNEWVVEYSPSSSFSPSTNITSHDTSLLLSGLTPGTTYYVRVSNVCSSLSASPRCMPISFATTTLFEPQNVIISIGNTSVHALPTDTRVEYTLSEQIYTASEIGRAGEINSLAFYNNESAVTRNIDFYLVRTNKNSFSDNYDWITVTAADLLFSGNLDFSAGGWTVINFPAPFVYNGTDNLLVVVNDKTNSSVYRRNFRTYPSTNQALQATSWNTNPSPTQNPAQNAYCSLHDYKNIIALGFNPIDCLAPTDLTVSNVGTDVANLAWIQPVDGNEWTVQYSTDPSFASPVEVVVFDTSWSLNNLNSGTTYYVRVANNCGSLGSSSWSNTASFTTMGQSSCPTPTNLTVANVTLNSIDLSWTENGTATEWQVCVNGDETNPIDVTENPYTLSGLALGTSYTVKVRANCGADGTSHWSNEVSFSTWSTTSNLVEIGSCTSGNENLPSNSYYNYGLSQQIYTPAEIGRAGSISRVSFYNDGDTKTRNYDMYLIHTSKSAFDNTQDWVPVTSADLVFSGSVEMIAGEWTTLDLDVPFTYNGIDNLVLVIDDNTQFWSQGMSCYSYPTAAHQSLYVVGDNSNYDPSSLTGIVGDFEDYKNCIKLDFSMPCPKPQNLTASITGQDEVTMSWVSNPTDFVVNYKKTTDTQWQEMTVTTNTATLSGLDPVAYEARVKAVCDPGVSESDWVTATFSNFDVQSTANWYCFAYSCPDHPEWENNYISFSMQNLASAAKASNLPSTYYPRTSTYANGYVWSLAYDYNTGYIDLFRAMLDNNNKTVGNFEPAMSVFDTMDISSMAYNPVDGKIYYLRSDQILVSFDPLFPDVHTVIGTYTQNFVNIAINGSGEAYCLDFQGDLYRVSTTDASADSVGNIPDAAGIAFDTETNEFFSISNDAMVRSVDPATANYQELYYIGGALYSYMTDMFIVGSTANVCYAPTVYVSAIGMHQADISWAPDNNVGSWVVEYGTDPNFIGAVSTTVTTNSILLTGLTSETIYYVRVKANCGNIGESFWTVRSFNTEICEPQNQCAVNYSLSDSYGDGWNGCAIQVRDVLSGIVINTLTMADGYSMGGYFYVCSGREISFEWIPSNFDNETSYTITDPEGNVIFSGSDAMTAPVTYTVNCPAQPCFTPDNLAVSGVTENTATLSWTETGNAAAWQICVNGDETNPIDVTTNPYTLTGLNSGTPYTVKVRANCGVNGTSLWSNEESFTTAFSLQSTANWYGFVSYSSDNPDWMSKYIGFSMQDLSIADTASAHYDNYPSAAAYANGYVWTLYYDNNYINQDLYRAPLDDNTRTIGHEELVKTGFEANGVSSMAYNPVDGRIYYLGDDQKLASFDPEVPDMITEIGTYSESFDQLAINSSGEAYCLLYTGDLYQISLTDASTIFVGNIPDAATIAFDQVTDELYCMAYSNAGQVICAVNPTTAAKHELDYIGGDSTLILTRMFMVGNTGTVCYAPQAVTVSAIGMNQATVSWTAANNVNGWVVEYGTAADFTGSTTVNVTANTCALTGLTSGTIYHVRVKANCGGGSESYWTVRSFNTSICEAANQCEISYELVDSWNDGWNGCAINVVDVASDIVVGTLTMNDGDTLYGTLSVCDGREIRFEWVDGYASYETSYTIYDPEGNVIFSGSDVLSTPVLYTMSCPTPPCPAPTSLIVSNITEYDAMLSWTENGSATEWQACINGDEANPVFIYDNPYTLDFLAPETSYTVKVRANCGANGYSTWSDEVTFTTQAPPPYFYIDGDDSICPGQTTILYVNTNMGTNYLWSTGETSQSITVPVGIYSVSVTKNGNTVAFGSFEVKAKKTYDITVTDAVCASSLPYMWNGDPYTASGNYPKTFTAANGCDSVVTLVLTVNPSDNSDFTETACNSYQWNNETFTTSGDYTRTLTNASGCDSVVTLHLTINSSDNSEFSKTACDLFTWEGTTYTQSGDYAKTFTNTSGCDSVVILHLTINQPTTGDTTAVACENFTWDGNTYTASGDYTSYRTNAAGCDSVVTLHLTVNHTVTAEITESACNSYEWNGQTYTTTGNYDQSFIATNGCDSIVTLHLTISPSYAVSDTKTVCPSALPYLWNGVTFTAAGDTIITLTAANGCDSVVTMTLSISAAYHENLTISTCNSYEWNGQTYTANGDYDQSFTAANGCDSIVTLHLTINQPTAGDTSAVACESFTWDGNTYTTSGDYTSHRTNAAGCDSVVTLHLTINQPTTGDTTAVACESFTWDGNTYTTSGDYTSHRTNAAGCDSVVTLHLTINQPTTGDTTAVACESFTWDGITYTTSGDYTSHRTNAAGCDSVVTLHLTINQPTTGDTSAVACESFTWDGNTYTTSGDYTSHRTNAAGCDSVVTLHLTVNHAVTSEITESACNSYEWNGQIYTTTGDYNQSFTAANGCDSIVTLHLTVNYGMHNVVTETACESFTWYGTEYTTSGTFTHEYTNNDGCASVDTLKLTVNHGTHNVVTETACESFTWYGTEYTTSGTYTHEYTNSDGCPSVDTLHLTINFATFATFADTVCGSYTWHGQTYTTSGTYTYNYTNASGCTSVDTLKLTVNPTYNVTDTRSVCPSEMPYTWNGLVFNAAGAQTVTLPTISGCDSVVTMILTVNQTHVSTVSRTICQSELPYTWNGVTFTSAGVQTATLQDANGCDSTVIMTLMVNPTYNITLTHAVCQSELPYTWNGITFTAVGSQSLNLQAVNGCDSIVTMTLTVNPIYNVTDTRSVCPNEMPYTWNGVTFNAAGAQTVTLQTANGCDSVVTMILTVNQTHVTTDSRIICQSELPYMWNGVTFNAAGVQTATLTDANGCDSTVIMTLTVNPTYNIPLTQAVCESELPYTWNGLVFTAAGSQSLSLQTVNGCDSIVTMTLTVNHGTHNIETETACESYEWHGVTYTTSGTYTYEYTNANGCASVDTLHLTISPADFADFAETACEQFVWEGTTYTVSGDYTQTFTNASGCDSVVTLHLTINHAVSSEFAIETSDSCYSWNGHLYCESGDYTQTLTAANGCDSVITLHLTITVGIDDHNLSASMTVYPNPTNGIVNVQCTINNVQVGTMEYHVFDAYGKLVDVVEMNANGSSAQTVQIDLSGFANGVYFVKAVADGNVVAVRKVVKR